MNIYAMKKLVIIIFSTTSTFLNIKAEKYKRRKKTGKINNKGKIKNIAKSKIKKSRK
jgi:hypothetical protein